MAGNQVPNNLEDKTVLKRFLTDLVLGLNANPYYSGNVTKQQEAIVEALASNPSLDFLNTVSKINELQTTIKSYVEDELETLILQNKEAVAVIAEQFGTFYEQALATSWYGLSVKAGGVVAGLEVGSLDPDVTTPGDESSYFRISADNFVVGRAYEDLSQAEKDYLAANNLPAFGTVYNASKQPVPALAISWDSINQVYKHYFNGIVNFSNIANADYAGAINNGSTTINGGKITTNSITADRISTYNLTANNATFENSIIKNAMIDNLSVDTLKIQNEAVVVPRASTGVGSTTIYYTPSTTHSVVFLLTGGFSAYDTVYRLYINGSVWYESPSAYGSSISLNILGTLYANTTYTITLNATVRAGQTIPTLQLVMLGVKR